MPEGQPRAVVQRPDARDGRMFAVKWALTRSTVEKNLTRLPCTRIATIPKLVARCV